MARVVYQSWNVADKPVKCGHCGFDQFAERPTLMNTTGATLFGFDWANKEATVLICGQCGHMEWFMQRPVEP